MTLPRKQQIDLDATAYYHCMGRCVRRAFLCGIDRTTGRNYTHRKQWVLDRLKQLAGLFAIDVCAYAVMSNHYHLVLHVNQDRAAGWSDDEVVRRWYRLYRRKAVETGAIPDAAGFDPDQIALWRSRLTDISWFMRALNEYIARRANREDDCKGRFWEGRFKSRALLDEAGLLTCMAYVDLNPVHARLATTPETSDYTSIQERIRQIKNDGEADLMPFADEGDHGKVADAIPFPVADYLTLVDWTGRAVRDDKRGHIPSHVPPILARLQLPPDQWLQLLGRYDSGFSYFVGRPSPLKALCQRLGRKWLKGQGLAQRLFAAASL